ncbi:5-bromo-4-chloroindolyl phosphate hydrolysis family protein [Weissella thailandensis]|uniref:5-bromo-4-chloroindolyl phosphate hydrolysis family protein n=1 Tax=Weissella thailandensis TaxID=89061 RepID=UPI0027E49477|nr:5-bromo-4-chloroindolyl phosphate hydrolysis family protein [Weissella thailandensis]
MFDLNNIPKQYWYKIRWGFFWGLFILGMLFSNYTNAATWLFIGGITVLGVSIKQIFRWVLPIVFVLLIIGTPQLGLMTQGILVLTVIGLRELLVIPHANNKRLKHQSRLKINTNDLTRRDVRVFKETFKRLRASAAHIEVLLAETVGLRRINVETKVVTYINATLAELAANPTQLTVVDNFAYRRLPNLEQLLVSYVEIAHHAVISDNDKKQLKEARQLIKQLAIAVHDDYRLVIRKDVNDLNDRMSTTKDTLGGNHD